MSTRNSIDTIKQIIEDAERETVETTAYQVANFVLIDRLNNMAPVAGDELGGHRFKQEAQAALMDWCASRTNPNEVHPEQKAA